MIATALQNMPDHAKAWVYQSGRPFTTSELVKIDVTLQAFVKQWKAHGQELAANFSIEYHQFIVLAVDESYHGASGCSIDSSLGTIRALEQELGLSLLDKSQVAVKQGDIISVFPFNEAKKRIASGEVTKETILFDNSIQSMGAFRSQWMIPAGLSWMKRFF